MEQIAGWRDRNTDRWGDEDHRMNACLLMDVPPAPKLELPGKLPVTRKGIYDLLMTHATTQCSLDGTAGKSEGIVIRNASRSKIAKAKIKNYARGSYGN